ncbi:MAG: hypothetical protein HOM85_07615, partial [Euryarchaeota archaeon]|nr:hypothetical protein [Euryarchaeota archaeon]
RGGVDLDFDDDWDDDEDDDDEYEDDFMSNILGGAQPRGPETAPARGPSRGPSQGPPSGRGPGGPSRGPSQGPPGGRGPSGPSREPTNSPDPRGPARGKKVAKRKPIGDGDGKVRKAKVTIDPDLFSQQELGDRVAAVDWTKGALQDGESERTILMQLQTTGWSAPQSRAIIDLSK